MTSDDFLIIWKVPGLYMFLGTGNRKPSTAALIFDGVLEVGIENLPSPFTASSLISGSPPVILIFLQMEFMFNNHLYLFP